MSSSSMAVFLSIFFLITRFFFFVVPSCMKSSNSRLSLPIYTGVYSWKLLLPDGTDLAAVLFVDVVGSCISLVDESFYVFDLVYLTLILRFGAVTDCDLVGSLLFCF